MLLGLMCLPDLGSMPDDHRLPETARTHVVGSSRYLVDRALAHRYADVAGDWSAHHFHIAAAQASGVDFLFAHGLCTMAICTQRVLGLLNVDDPGRVVRVAVRFSSPTPLGADLVVNAYGVGDNRFAFEAFVNGVATITNGRLDIRP